MTLKTAKRKKIRSMAMAYKTEFEHVSRRDAKNEKPWIKNNYHHIVHVKHLKTVTHSSKSNKVMKNKLKQLNKHSVSPLEPLPHAAGSYVSKRKNFAKHGKKKISDAKRNKKAKPSAYSSSSSTTRMTPSGTSASRPSSTPRETS